MKKKALCIIFSTMFATSLIGCGAVETVTPAPAAEDTAVESAPETTVAATEESTVAEETTQAAEAADLGLLTEGTLAVGMEIGYPPFEDFASDGETPIGFDVDMAKAVADYLGLEVEYVDTAWDGIFDGLKTDKYDCIMSAVTINPERLEEMDFSTPYIQNYQSLVIIKGSDVAAADIIDVNGLTVGYQGATTSQEYLDGLIATGEVTCTSNEYDKVIDAFSDLDNGRLDIILCDSSVADGYVASDPDKYEIVWQQQDEVEEFGIAIKKGNSALVEAVNEALTALEADGTMEEIRATWLY